MKSDKEIADQLDAEDRLKKRGARQVKCRYDKCIEHRMTWGRCPRCGDKGYEWIFPIEC